MSRVTFYEKPGCVGNHRQKAELRRHGVALEVRDLLTHPWTIESLRPFFGKLPVRDWFNLSAPRIKGGEVAIDECDEATALRLMLDDPLLIRRPLMQREDHYQAGFVDGPVLSALGIRLLPGQDLQTCPMDDAAPACEILA
jgi:nitrogenase-associated protein